MTPATSPTTAPEASSFDRRDPQCVFINRAPSTAWNQNRPDTVEKALFTEVLDTVGARANLAQTRRLGLSFILSYLNGSRDVLTETLRRLLSLAEKLETPVLIVLDGQNWWDGRPDLWNWWDAHQPGFDPKNVENVEWTDPGAEHAVKVCWRNWGRQLRVKPAPNLMSARYRDACRAEIEHFAPIIKTWADKLAPERRYLFPGLKVGWEASIGINAFHYPNGNHYIEASPDDETNDPHGGLDKSRDFAGGLVPLGYAALASEGVKPKDARVTLADHERIVASYLQFLASACRGVGYEARHLFLHSGGQFAPWPLHYSHKVPITADAVPGWSLYNTAPDAAGDLGASLDAASRNDWCAAEWLTHAETAEGWKGDLSRALNFRHCRNLTIYNWEGIATKPWAIDAVRQVVSEPTAS